MTDIANVCQQDPELLETLCFRLRQFDESSIVRLAVLPEGQRPDHRSSDAQLHLTPKFIERLSQGIDFLGFKDPDAALEWVASGPRSQWYPALESLLPEHQWSMDRMLAAEGSSVECPSLHTMAKPSALELLDVIATGKVCVFSSTKPGVAELCTLDSVDVVVAGTANAVPLSVCRRLPESPELCRVNLSVAQWMIVGAPLFQKEDFQFSQILTFSCPGELDPAGVHRDVLDEWLTVIEGELDVFFVPPSTDKHRLAGLGHIRSTQFARSATAMHYLLMYGERATLAAGDWLVIPRGWYKTFRARCQKTLALRHYWRF